MLNRVNYWDMTDFVYICCEKMREKRMDIKRPKTNKEKLPRIGLIVYGRDNTVGGRIKWHTTKTYYSKKQRKSSRNIS